MRKLLIGAALLSTFVVGAIAQTIATFNLTGSEVILGQAGGPGGTGIFIPSYVMRNGRGISTIGAVTTLNLSATATVDRYIATGAITTANVTLPRSPFNGQKWSWVCPGGTTSTLTISGNAPSGVTLIGLTAATCTSASPMGAGFTYNTATNAWYRTD
jgi:hypothetical protein